MKASSVLRPRKAAWSGRLFSGPEPPMTLFSESLGKACIGARRLPGRFLCGLTASKGPSWWKTAGWLAVNRCQGAEPFKTIILTSGTKDARGVELVNHVQLAARLLVLVLALAMPALPLAAP